jgi:hypothetical protein
LFYNIDTKEYTASFLPFVVSLKLSYSPPILNLLSKSPQGCSTEGVTGKDINMPKMADNPKKIKGVAFLVAPTQVLTLF